MSEDSGDERKKETIEDAASESEVVENVPLKGSLYQSLVLQFVHPLVRGDFLDGKLKIASDPARDGIDKEDILERLDRLRMRVIPQLQQSVVMKTLAAEEAIDCLRNLILKKSEVLVLGCESQSTLWTYETYGNLLDDLGICTYWAFVTPENLSLQYLTVPERFHRNPVDENGHCEPPEVKFKVGAQHTKQTSSPTRKGSVDGMPQQSYSSKDERATKKKPQTVVDVSDSSLDTTCSELSDNEEVILPTSRSGHSRRREVIKPNIFVMNGWQSLRQWLQGYEKYFAMKYRGSSRDCTQHLSQFLPERMLEYYEALGGHRLKYEDMKQELITWYRSQERHSPRHWRQQLMEVEMKENESLKVYALRLLELGMKSYPHDVAERTRELRHRFMETVPSDFARHLQITQDASSVAGHGKKLLWPEIVRLAEKEDERKHKMVKKSAAKVGSQVWFNRQETKDLHSAPSVSSATCCSCKSVSVPQTVSSSGNAQAQTSHCALTGGNKQALGQQGGSKRKPRRPRTFTASNAQGQAATQTPAVTASSGSPASAPSPSSPAAPASTSSQTATAAAHQGFRHPPCNWCGRVGHSELHCWERADNCLICGENTHNSAVCPRRQAPICPVCRGAHLGRECSQLN